MHRGVHQTAQTAKTASKPPTKRHNCTAPHRTASNSALHCIAPHCTAPHPLYILIYLFIFNIKYISNSLITLLFKKKIV